jgi:16S rRNA processing protein RimM
MGENGEKLVELGRITGLFGVRGWVKVFSGTQPRDDILGYPTWYLLLKDRWVPAVPEEGRSHGKGIVAKIKGFDDRDQAMELLEAAIAVPRSQLPEAGEGEYYWTDLIGLAVVTTEGVDLGRVAELFETGANDVIVVAGERERLIPFLQGSVVTDIDLEAGRLTVDWDPDF